MSPEQQTIAAGVTGTLGLWLMVPPRTRQQWALGGVLSAVSLGLFGGLLPGLGEWFATGTFWVLAVVTLLGGLGMVTSLHPVYSALWFALSLLGTAGLYAYAGAQFLAAATIVVYAGAIVVTFLFVLMLAQPDGTAYYDRVGVGRVSSLLSAAAGMALVAILTLTLSGHKAALAQGASTAAQLEGQVLHPQHVAVLGGAMYAKHLLAVELAGVLLLVALVGASVIMLAKRERPAKEARHG